MSRPTSFGKRQISMSPDDMKVGSRDNTTMNTGLRAPMPKPRRKLFTHGYWNGSSQHPDNLHGNQSGRQSVT